MNWTNFGNYIRSDVSDLAHILDELFRNLGERTTVVGDYMFTAILITLGVLNTAMTFLALAALGRLVVEQRDFHQEFLGAVQLFLHVGSDLDERVRSAMQCLVSKDAALDAIQNPEETRQCVR